MLDLEALESPGKSAALVASCFRRLVTVWTLFGPMPCLSTDQASVSYVVPQGLRVCHRASLEGGQHLSMPCLFLSLLLLFCYKRYWWLSGPSHLKRQQGPAVVAAVT